MNRPNPRQVLLGLLLVIFSACPLAAMTVDDVIELLDAGIGEAVIFDQFEAKDARFALSTNDILELKEAGASDALLREMIRRTFDDPSGPGGQMSSSQGDVEAQSQDSGNGTYNHGYDSAYYGGAVSLGLYYDPFGYYWYAWPHYFTYYYPFPWYDCGVYYAGWWSYRWWGWGPWTSWCWDNYHWTGCYYVAVERGGRHAWSREPDGRYVDHRSSWDRASGGSGHRTVDGRAAYAEAGTRDGNRSATRPARESRWSRSSSRGSRPAQEAYGRAGGSRSPSGAPRPSGRPPSVRSAPPSRPAPSPPAQSGSSSGGGGSRSGRGGWGR